jgi:hypothetical protein
MSDYIQLAAIRGHTNCSNFIQLAAIRGTPNRSKKATEMLLDDFYTLCQKNPMNNYGLRKKSPSIHGEIIFRSSDVTIDYICSDFVRFCLSFYKITQNLYNDQMSLIPKQSFTISEELREYIEEFLPDYYGIRK